MRTISHFNDIVVLHIMSYTRDSWSIVHHSLIIHSNSNFVDKYSNKFILKGQNSELFKRFFRYEPELE